MSVDTVSTFLSVGALILLGCVTAVGLLRLGALGSVGMRNWYESIRLSMEGLGLRLAWVMALIATLGSLYYSEIAGFLPCEYCWYQRIAMYPLVIILGIAIVKGHAWIRPYVLGLAIPGAVIAVYHFVIERFPDLQVGECNLCIPCTVAWFRKFGIVTIPFMAFVSFAVIITVLLLDRSAKPESEPSTERPAAKSQ